MRSRRISLWQLGLAVGLATGGFLLFGERMVSARVLSPLPFGAEIEAGLENFFKWTSSQRYIDVDGILAVLLDVWTWFIDLLSGIKMAQLIAAGLGAAALGILSLVHNWWRNIRIREMCSAQLYITAVKLDFHALVVWNAHRVNGMTVDAFQDSGQTEVKTLTLAVDDDVRAALHRLSSELNLLQEFSIAYDYAFWRTLRVVAARTRMRAQSAKEAIEVIMSELDRKHDLEEASIREPRYLVHALKGEGMSAIMIPLALQDIVKEVLRFGEKLELGWLRQSWRGKGKSLPKTASKFRAGIQQSLEIARRHLEEQVESGEVWWSVEPKPVVVSDRHYLVPAPSAGNRG